MAALDFCAAVRTIGAGFAGGEFRSDLPVTPPDKSGFLLIWGDTVGGASHGSHFAARPPQRSGALDYSDWCV
jgi:hypothetical protein